MTFHGGVVQHLVLEKIHYGVAVLRVPDILFWAYDVVQNNNI